MNELKPCPFCGGKPEFIDNSGEHYNKNNVSARPGRTFLRRETVSRGSRRTMVNYYVYLVKDWQVHCSTKGCFARNLNKHFHSKEEAIEAWNRRAEDGK
jgi:hypothetical protein